MKEKVPGVQLAMVGMMAGDDPQGWEILEKINAEALKDSDMYVFTNMTGVGGHHGVHRPHGLVPDPNHPVVAGLVD